MNPLTTISLGPRIPLTALPILPSLDGLLFNLYRGEDGGFIAVIPHEQERPYIAHLYFSRAGCEIIHEGAWPTPLQDQLAKWACSHPIL